MTKNIYCVVGKSGTGKDTIVNKLCDSYGYNRVKSYTTREQRVDLNDSKSHLFTDVEEYKKHLSNGIIMAETNFNDNYYWVTKEQLDNADLYILDLDGLKTLKERYKTRPIVSIIVNADKDIRRQRMTIRGDNKSKIEERIQFDENAFPVEEIKRMRFDFIISNNFHGNLNGIVNKLHECIQECENSSIKKKVLI